MIGAVVTDMDNTLYSWVDYIVPSSERMIETVCRALNLPKIQVIQALKEVYERYESNDYPFALQESRLFEPYQRDFGLFQTLVIEPAAIAFSSARKSYLKPYRWVPETLQALRQMNIPVIALTDAPRNPAERRAKHMHLDQYFSAIYTLPSFPFPQTGIDETIRHREQAGGIQLDCPVYELPREAEKPDPQGLLSICERFSVAPKDVLLVGDSLAKDMKLACEAGAISCWAEYGTYVSAEYLERLAILSAPSATRRHLRHAPAAYVKPQYRLSGFDQVLDIVQNNQ